MLRFQSALDGLKIALVGGSGIGDSLKQNIDKLAEFFNSLAQNEGGLKRFANVLKSFIKILATGTAGIVAFKVATNTALITTRLITVATNAWGTATLRLNRALRIMNVVIQRNPIGLVVGLLTAAASALLVFRDRTSDAADEQERLNQKLREEQELLDSKVYDQFLERMKLMKRVRDEQTGYVNDVIASNEEVEEALRKSVETMSEDDLLQMAKFLRDRFAESSRAAEEEDNSVLQKIFIGDAKSWESQYKLVKAQLERLQKLRNSLDINNGRGGKTVTPESDSDPVEDALAQAQIDMRESLLVAQQMFADREIETQDELNQMLFEKQVIHLKSMLEIEGLTVEQKLELEEKLAKVRSSMVKQDLKQTKDAEKEKSELIKANIDNAMTIGSSLSQIGEVMGKNSAAAKAGIAITKAASIASAIKGIIDAKAAITKQAASGDPFSAFARIAMMAAAVAPLIASLVALKGGGDEGGTTQTGESRMEKLERGGLTRGGMFQGASHAHGGVKFAVGGRIMEAEGGEAIINKRSTAAFKPILSAINSYNGNGVKFADGGLINSGEKFALGGTIRSAQQMISSAMGGSTKVVVVESDLTTTQNKVSALQSQASF